MEYKIIIYNNKAQARKEGERDDEEICKTHVNDNVGASVHFMYLETGSQ